MDRVLIIAGPTASGKSGLGIELAKRLNGEIISADSMQVYRGMDIGTAKVTKDEMQGVPHHLIDVVNPDEEWNVMRFCKEASACISDISARGKLAIVVGGTGFYLHALIYGAEFEDEPESSFRAELEAQDTEILYQGLQAVDPASAASIHANNRKRVIRALEYYLQTGERFSAYNARQKKKKSPYDFVYLVLNRDRKELYRRINVRVDRMMEDGLVQEVEGLLATGLDPKAVSMQGLGYKEIEGHLSGRTSLSDAVEELKLGTRHFAKRQLTWYRREADAVWIDAEPTDTLTDRCLQIIENNGWRTK